ncbi:MAG TPA: ferredoxin [Spirochaetota bacterium]|nr:ferredoxin [Spirochaetota bacterium]
MADKENKTDGNAAGAWYVDTECTACGVCEDEAPENFKMGDEAACVYKQPENDEEKEACAEAKDACPADAIGDDG